MAKAKPLSPASEAQAALDHRLMGACLRYARRHRGLTGTNPSVGTLLVQFEDGEPVIVGRGVTAKGGRPHAERQAIEEAGTRARGATAYVSLEPCAHHGATPPCAQGLIDAGVKRVVTAWIDPDPRVDGKGHAMLRAAGITVDAGLRAQEAALDLSGYLNRKLHGRPQVTLKLAVSSDGFLGVAGKEVAITSEISRALVHRLRAEHDGILVGRTTAQTDDPELTVRLEGLQSRSPARFILDTSATLDQNSKLAQTANSVPTSVVTAAMALPEPLQALGVQQLIADSHEGRLALPELLEDLGASGMSSLMVEGGAEVASSFMEAGLVDTIALFEGAATVGAGGIPSPITLDSVPDQYQNVRSLKLGDDHLHLFSRI